MDDNFLIASDIALEIAYYTGFKIEIIADIIWNIAFSIYDPFYAIHNEYGKYIDFYIPGTDFDKLVKCVIKHELN